jgi:hypothetical protein
MIYGMSGLGYIVASTHIALIVTEVLQNSDELGLLRANAILGEIEVSIATLTHTTNKVDEFHPSMSFTMSSSFGVFGYV